MAARTRRESSAPATRESTASRPGQRPRSAPSSARSPQGQAASAQSRAGRHRAGDRRPAPEPDVAPPRSAPGDFAGSGAAPSLARRPGSRLRDKAGIPGQRASAAGERIIRSAADDPDRDGVNAWWPGITAPVAAPRVRGCPIAAGWISAPPGRCRAWPVADDGFRRQRSSNPNSRAVLRKMRSSCGSMAKRSRLISSARAKSSSPCRSAAAFQSHNISIKSSRLMPATPSA